MLSRKFKAHLGVQVIIPLYRHLSIAISRKHLPCSGFKRDYGLENTKFDAQSAHSLWTVGCIYAQGLEEAPGHVKSRKALYRTVSQEWHGFLGFATSLKQAEKRPLTEVGNQIVSPRKRQCTCLSSASPDAWFMIIKGTNGSDTLIARTLKGDKSEAEGSSQSAYLLMKIS